MRLVNKKHYIIAISQLVSTRSTGQQASFIGRIASIGGDRVRQLFLLLVLLAFVGGASATDYYVATWGDNENAGTLSSPKASFESTWLSSVQPGDTIYLVDGVWYNDSIYCSSSSGSDLYMSGNATHHIAITAYNGTPTFDNSKNQNSTAMNGITMYSLVAGADAYIDIKNIVFKDTIIGAKLYGVNHVVLDNVTLNGSNPYSHQILCEIKDSTNITVNNSVLTRSGWNAIIFESSNVNVSDIIIDNNELYANNQHNAFDSFSTASGIYAQRVTISNNVVHDCTDVDGHGIGFFFVHATDGVYNSQYFTFINNTFYNYGDTDGGLTTDYLNDSIVKNCIFRDSKSGITGIHGSNNLTFRNVSAWNITGKPQVSISPSWDTTYLFDACNLSDMRIINVGTFIVQDNYHIGAVQINTANGGNIIYNFTDGTVFSENGANETRYYPDRSEYVTIGDETVTFVKYNITLDPVYAYLKDVTVNHESTATDDRTNITVNSSVTTNPTWINATMQNASNTYNVSIDGIYVTQVVSGSDKVVRYQYTGSWSSHDFEFDWSAGSSPWSPSVFGNYYNTTDQIKITVKGYGNGSHIFSRSPQQSDNNAPSFKIMVVTT